MLARFDERSRISDWRDLDELVVLCVLVVLSDLRLPLVGIEGRRNIVWVVLLGNREVAVGRDASRVFIRTSTDGPIGIEVCVFESGAFEEGEE